MINRIGQQLGNYQLLRLLGQGVFDAIALYDEGIENDEFDLSYRQQLHEQKLSFLEE